MTTFLSCCFACALLPDKFVIPQAAGTDAKKLLQLFRTIFSLCLWFVRVVGILSSSTEDQKGFWTSVLIYYLFW